MDASVALKDTGLSELYLAYALHNIERITLFPRMLEPLNWDTLKVFYHGLARDLLANIKPG